MILLFPTFSFCQGISSQQTLTQPPTQSASSGQTIKLPCTVNGAKNIFGWLQKRSGQALRFLFYAIGRGSGVPSRFSITESGNTGYLTITDLQAEDEAYYYCYMYNSGSQSHRSEIWWGTETKTCFLPLQIAEAKIASQLNTRWASGYLNFKEIESTYIPLPSSPRQEEFLILTWFINTIQSHTASRSLWSCLERLLKSIIVSRMSVVEKSF